MTAGEATIDVVRGALADDRAEQILGFWASRGALEGEQARQRLPEVVCVAMDPDGAVIGVNSARAEETPPVGRRFWRYRSFIPDGGRELEAAMFNAAFEALGEGFDPDVPGPLGLAVAVTDRSRMEARPEAVWPEEELFYAGYLDDGSQLRLRYFWNAKIGPGTPNSPPLEETMEEEYPVGATYRVVPLSESGLTEDDVLALWARETGIPDADAQRRVHEVQLVAVKEDGTLVAVSTAYTQRNEQLRMDFWHFRTYVAVAERHSNLAGRLALAGCDHLEQGYIDGHEDRAAGLVMEIENEGLRTYFNRALWLPLGLHFIGELPNGAHVRVRYFPGAKVTPPG